MAEVVWLARHGNRQDFVDPQWPETAERPHDPGLSDDGIEQARRLGRRLAGEGIRHLFASPFLRTVETAHYVAEALDLRIRLEPGLGEWLNPAWFPAPPVTLPVEALAARFSRVDPTYAPRFELTYPETEEAALGRAGRAARALAAAHEGPLLLVGHGASVTGAARGFVEAEALTECALCSLTKVVRREENRWTMELCADVAHLEERLGATRFN